MYLIIPLSLIFSSVLTIGVIIWRKAPYLKKLAAVEGGALNGSLSKKDFLFRFFSDLSPEIVNAFRNIKLQEYKEAWFVELEKFLRRLRLVSLRMDRWSNSWIQGIRKRYESGSGTMQEQTTVSNIDKEDDKKETKQAVESDAEFFKKEEQRIIIEIARNPKDSNLYDTLADLYVKMGEYDDAKESYEAAIELDPNNEELKKKLSLALEKIRLSRSSQG